MNIQHCYNSFWMRAQSGQRQNPSTTMQKNWNIPNNVTFKAKFEGNIDWTKKTIKRYFKENKISEKEAKIFLKGIVNRIKKIKTTVGILPKEKTNKTKISMHAFNFFNNCCDEYLKLNELGIYFTIADHKLNTYVKTKKPIIFPNLINLDKNERKAAITNSLNELGKIPKWIINGSKKIEAKWDETGEKENKKIDDYVDEAFESLE